MHAVNSLIWGWSQNSCSQPIPEILETPLQLQLFYGFGTPSISTDFWSLFCMHAKWTKRKKTKEQKGVDKEKRSNRKRIKQCFQKINHKFMQKTVFNIEFMKIWMVKSWSKQWKPVIHSPIAKTSRIHCFTFSFCKLQKRSPSRILWSQLIHCSEYYRCNIRVIYGDVTIEFSFTNVIWLLFNNCEWGEGTCWKELYLE